MKLNRRGFFRLMGIAGASALLQPTSAGAGDRIWLKGPNGSGKSTLLKLMCGMIPHFQRGRIFQGEVSIDGRSLTRHPPKAFFPLVGYIPPRDVEFFLLTESLGEEILLCEAFLQSPPGWSDSVEALIAQIPLAAGLRNLPLPRMSEGEKRLALFVLYLCQGAELFLLDEVFRSSDPRLDPAWEALLDRAAARGAAVLYAGHEPMKGATSAWTIRKKKLITR